MNPAASDRARQNILQRLRSSQAHPAPTHDSEWQPEVFDHAKGIACFIEQLEIAHAEIVPCDEQNWPEKLLEIATSRELHCWLHGADSEAGKRWQEIAQQASQLTLRPYDHQVETFKSELFNQIEAGLVEACGGIAATGTLVVVPSAEEPRLMSLVPPTNVILFRTSTLVSNFNQLISQQQWSQGMPTNALLISGPSKTADIQQTLAYGAHGPKSLIVMVIDDGAPTR